MTYAEKLKDPRWQKKRLEIMQRDEWKCKLCGDGESTLHVHNKDYIKGNDPWEYENINFITLCEDCHYEVELAKNDEINIDDILIYKSAAWRNKYHIMWVSTPNYVIMRVYDNNGDPVVSFKDSSLFDLNNILRIINNTLNGKEIH